MSYTCDYGRTKVQCRYLSGHRVPVRGVYLGATVVRGHDWRWSDQDGGRGGEGTVVEISGWHSESSVSDSINHTLRSLPNQTSLSLGVLHYLF